jgi:two-component system, sensor histidine kinase and response regulator
MDGYIGKPRGFGTTPSSAPTPEAILDRSALLERVQNDAELLDELIVLFKKDSARHLATLQGALDKGEADTLRRAAHTLRGACGNLAVPLAAAAALELEQMGSVGDLSKAREVLAQLKIEMDRALPILEELRQECIR